MIASTKILVLTFFCVSASTHNPILTGVGLLLSSTTIFFFMSMISGSTWLPMIFYLIFMGGILVTFMTISAIMPNEKMDTTKNLFSAITTLSISALCISNISKMEDQSIAGLKFLMESSHTTVSIMIIVLLYFFVFIKILDMEKLPLRTTFCQNKKNIVSFMSKIWQF